MRDKITHLTSGASQTTDTVLGAFVDTVGAFSLVGADARIGVNSQINSGSVTSLLVTIYGTAEALVLNAAGEQTSPSPVVLHTFAELFTGASDEVIIPVCPGWIGFDVIIVGTSPNVSIRLVCTRL